ncbi:hypothetical protein [Teredinibacter haidensis]|uniref:hypothetical protein n=1 Tax=Teredinibacter haidensis TaxID=2731755 RepID=UPI0009490354|nr:hypothetical protein [Teredinibacter haidensis]
MAKVLIFTLAARGYHWQYRRIIESQRAYAEKHCYSYSVVDRPRLTTVGLDIAWLKIYLLQKALAGNYDWVMFVDADAEIKDVCPAIESLAQENKSIYVAKGHSGRINSGVLIFQNTRASRDFIDTVINNCRSALPPEDDVGWGENGTIIHYAKNNPSVAILDQRWNNNSDPRLTDYIRHYSAGPMRQLYKPRRVDYLKFRGLHYCLALAKRVQHILGGARHASISIKSLSVQLQREFPLFK